MRILVTGKNGQLGRSIQKIVDNKNIFVFVGRDQLDLTSISSIETYFNNNKFDVVINCAAYTNVDKAEVDTKKVNLINHIAVAKIAKIAKLHNTKLIHISTDFVFDGLKRKPYIETDVTSPLNIYGETKLAGELAVMSIMRFNSIIIRTGWLYSEFKYNFLKTIMSLAKNNSTLDVVSDQIGTPTYANDLAHSILHIINSKKFSENNFPSEIFHFSNEGESSWYEFAEEIISISGINCQLKPIYAEDYPSCAKRPKYSILSKKKILLDYDLKINHWRDSLRICLKNL
jgi:dTDP-4-dehydrorhamnose reductase